jgi:superfamily II RNA helicase
MIFKGLTLDKFQEDASIAIENNQSVMVSAPTGSGKTLIADYLISLAIKEKKRIIYTAPIKALSNQKYRDFISDHGEEKIGLITGDLVINREAQILIMTTEIYRNMAIMKDELLESVAYCVMDEIHFISDFERGYVWEESIIFSPQHIRFLFLSATVPNADEFASWVKKIKEHEVIVVKHNQRPVPLEKKFYDSELGITSIDKIKKQKDLDSYPEYNHNMRRKPWQKRFIKMPSYGELIIELHEKNKLPCIFFVFSRAKSEDYATKLGKHNNFLIPEESKKMNSKIQEAFSNISPEIKGLSSTITLKESLYKGIAFHHAGMLPDTKHIVEQLFGEGLIKVLFATETFAVGINMPARTVCLDSLVKYTGTGFRYLTSKEYFQLSGRAGRRGIDSEGLSVAMINRRGSDLKKIESLVKADTLPIKSQFRLSPNTVLNMINLHNTDEIDEILTMNFFTFQKINRQTKKPVLLSSIRARYDNLVNSLEKMNYIKEGKLTELGLFTTKIFSNEIEISQLFATKFDFEFDAYTMMLAIAAILFEEKKDSQFFGSDEPKKIKQLISAIQSHPNLKKGKWYKHIVPLTAIIRPFFEEKKFVDILKCSSLPEGDLIRFFMQIIDKLEQIKKATRNEKTAANAENSINAIRKSLEGIHVF